MEGIVRNNLYPVFFKLSNLKVLIVGGGEVAREKLTFLFKSSPDATVDLIALMIKDEVLEILNQHKENITRFQREIQEDDISNYDIIIAATNRHETNLLIHKWSKNQGKIINVADTPDLCDFYMGSIVTRGNLKIAISTNGQSPTFAKRFRQVLEEILPENTDSLITNLHKIRNQLKGNFADKVNQLNKITQSLIS